MNGRRNIFTLIPNYNPNSIWIGSSVFVGLTVVAKTDRQTHTQTHRPRYAC